MRASCCIVKLTHSKFTLNNFAVYIQVLFIPLGQQGLGWSCATECLDWVLDKGPSPRGWLGPGTDFPGKWSEKPDRAPEMFGECSQVQSVILEMSSAGSGIGLDDPCGTLPTQHIPRDSVARALIFTVFILTFSAAEKVTNCITQGFIQFCTIPHLPSRYDLNIFLCILFFYC